MMALGRGCCAGVASPAAFCHDLQRREPQNLRISLPSTHFFSRSYYELSASCRPRRVKSLERLARALGVPVMEQLE